MACTCRLLLPCVAISVAWLLLRLLSVLLLLQWLSLLLVQRLMQVLCLMVVLRVLIPLI